MKASKFTEAHRFRVAPSAGEEIEATLSISSDAATKLVIKLNANTPG
jgi:hypothetical protein